MVRLYATQFLLVTGAVIVTLVEQSAEPVPAKLSARPCATPAFPRAARGGQPAMAEPNFAHSGCHRTF